MNPMYICIVIFIVSIILYAVNKWSMGTVGMATVAVLVLTGCMDAKTALTYFASTNVIMVMSMFVVSAGLSKTSMIDRFSAAVTRMTGGSFKRTYLCYLILAVVLTNFLNSPLVVFTIILPLALAMCEEYQVPVSKVMFPIGLTCIACCCILPFGAAIQQSALYNGFLESYGFTELTFATTDFMKGRWPFLIIVPVWAYTMGYKLAPEKSPVPVEVVNVPRSEKKMLKPVADIAGVVIFFAVVILCIFGSRFGLATWQVCFTGAVLNVLFGVLDDKEAIKALPVNLACMLVGALALAGALSSTGAGDVVGNALSAVIGGISNPYLLGAIFFVIPFALTQCMQNQAVMTIFVPICLLACKAVGANPIGLMVLITAGSLTAFMTPMATSAIPAVMGAGGYDIKALIRQGWLCSLIFTVLYIAYTMTVMPCF